MSNCTNCSHQLYTDSQFCKLCGQSIICFERPFKPVFMDMIHETLDIDGRMFQTLRALMFKPGLLSLEYCQGKRMKYTPPLRMYLVISIVFFLLLPLLNAGSLDVSTEASTRAGYYPKIMFCLLPVFALMLQLLFRGTYYLSNLIFSIHVHCIIYLSLLVDLLLDAFFEVDANSFFIYVLALFNLSLMIYLFSYCALALKRKYGQSWTKTLVKYVLLMLGYFAVVWASFEVVLQGMN